MTTQDPLLDYQALVERCWNDEDFRNRLLSNPLQVLREEGYNFPEGSKVHIHQNTPDHLNLILPSTPENLSDEELSDVAGGAGSVISAITRSSSSLLTVYGSDGAGKALALGLGGMVVGGGTTYALLKALNK
jgi:hypothetical protein